jgi:hypothetical protein
MKNIITKKILGGLNLLPQDKRDFKLGAIYTLPPLSVLPKSFALENPYPPDTQEDDFCSGYTCAGIAALLDGSPCSGKSAFGFSKHLTKDQDSFGQTMRDAFKAMVEIGCLSKQDEPSDFSFRSARHIDEREDFIALKDKARIHRYKTYFAVQGKYDIFDDIRASLFKFRVPVAIGLLWGWDISQYKIDTPAENGTGHMIYCFGWENDYLLVRNSYGNEAGKEGNHLIHRSVINRDCERYGAMMPVDLPREEAERRIRAGIKDTDNWFIDSIKSLYSFSRGIFNFLLFRYE